MFDYMRSAIVNKNRTIDPRIVGSILKSVVNVIQTNTTLPLQPQPVKPIKSNAETTDVTAMCSFHGDGLQGTIIITTETKLVTVMVEKMLGLSPENVDTEMINDLMLELLNQVMGVVRLELREFSYDLNQSAFFVVHGDNHSYMQRALGKNFELPFIYEDCKFKVKFCYDTYSDLNKFNDTYATLDKSTNILNVELVNAAISAISEALSSYTQAKADHLADDYYRQTILTSSVTNYAHGVSALGDYNFLMNLDEASARLLGHKMLFMPAEEIPMDLLLDSCGELLNQISANFRTISEKLGYKFRHVFHGDFGTEGELSNSIRTNSKFLELNFKTVDFPITVYFGSYWKSRYNILDLHSTLENLNKKSSA
ncbi:MAG: hypothetical protein HOI01_08195 [Proteobacteria bacterium]|nr:hypothetical protein [Pseudomonadota bacterium]